MRLTFPAANALIFVLALFAASVTSVAAQPASASPSQLPTGQILQIILPVSKTNQRRGIILTGPKNSARYFIGVANQPFVDVWQKGKWQRQWRPWRWHSDAKLLDLYVLHLGAMLFLEVGEKGDLQTLFEVGDAPLHVEASPESKAAWTIHPATISHPAKPTGELRNRPALVNYVGWYPADLTLFKYSSLDVDFPVYPLAHRDRSQIEQAQLRQMAQFGWTGVEVDQLFFSPKLIHGQYDLLKRFISNINQAGLKDFHVCPFLETEKAKPRMTAAGVEYLLCRLGNNPAWAHWRGRPVIFSYGVKMRGSAFWKQVVDEVRQSGGHPFWIFDMMGIRAYLYGTFDKAKIKPYLSLCDGAFTLSGSALLQGANFFRNLRVGVGGEYPNLVIGASVWPGYLSSRPTMRNFNSPMGTKLLRDVWHTLLDKQPQPQFLNWTTWNDYTESTTLSQSYSILTSRLEIAQRYLCHYRNQPLPKGRKDKPEAVLSYRKCIYQGEPITFEFLPLPTQEGPKRGKWHLDLLNEQGEKIAEADSPEVALDSMTPWNWELTRGADRSKTRVVHVRPTLKVEGGPTIHYANLPDIAVAVPTSYADQLYYSVPLHRLATADHHVTLSINGSDRSAVAALGLRAIHYQIQGLDSGDAQLASMRDAHALRFLAPVDTRGAELITDAVREYRVHLKPLKPGESTDWTCWAPTETDGRDYFAALARFPDGTWAYSPTVWAVPPVDSKQIQALWIFAPSDKERSTVRDRSIHHVDLTIPEDTGLKFITLPGNGRALRFDGRSSLKAPAHVGNPGPITLEVLFRPGKMTRHRQVLVYQRGAQASLILDEQGRLVGQRLPEFRKSHDPFVQVRSPQPLRPGRFYDAVVRFDGKELTLYLDGKRVDAKPCEGTRSTEEFMIGGPIPGSEVVGKDVDGLPADGFFRGDMVRMSLFAGALSDQKVADIAARATILPFWNDRP